MDDVLKQQISQKLINRAKQRYYLNPKICLFCGKVIPFNERKNKKKFCNNSCSASYNNKKRKVKQNFCLHCSLKLKYSAKKYCSNFCKTEFQFKVYISNWKEGIVSGSIGAGKHISVDPRLRKFLFNKFNSQCAECSWNKINPITNKIPLEIEHIDGDCTNNKEENLTLLCPSCHSLTSTYKSLNSGKSKRK